jgi:MFS family permease
MKVNQTEISGKYLVTAAVVVAAMGYFVDIYDLLLFSIVRVPSLKGLGFTGQALTDNGIFLLNIQMLGLLLGGICWGILGDKKGRLYVLFGSIFCTQLPTFPMVLSIL